MAVSFAGRWESRFTVPSGGASISATVANGGSAATVTVPAASYFLTAAGGISGLVSTLQTQLNATAALHGFPRTAAVMDTVVGGDWTNGSGWLCQEASGDLAPVFGAVTLADSGSPTYQNDGIKDGDYAVGFDTTGSDAFDGGDTFDVPSTDDLIVAGVAKFTATPSGTSVMVTKGSASETDSWAMFASNAPGLTFRVRISSSNTDVSTGSFSPLTTAEYFAFLFVIDRSTGKSRIAAKGLTSGTKAVSAEGTISASNIQNATTLRLGTQTGYGAISNPYHVSALYIVSGAGAATGLSAGLSDAIDDFAAAINAAWSVSLSDTTGQVTIDWTGYATPTHSLTWTSTTLRDVLGFDANISNATSATTGADQSPACWLPDAPLNVDGHPAMTPEETDLRVTESPTGVTLGLAGNTKYVHTNVRYRRVPVDRIREASTSVGNASLEVFLRNTQFGQGDISWFTPASPCQVYWNSAGTLTLLGDDANSGAGVAGWTIVGVSSFSQAVRLSQDGFVGQFDVTFPRLVSAG